MKEDTCLACGHFEGNRGFSAREMMLGTRELFHYVECNHCKSLQIASLPANLGDYYPSHYYSFARLHGGKFRRYLRSQRLRYALISEGIVGQLLFHAFGPPDRSEWTKMVKIGLNDRILDVGCGSGHLLADLEQAGFKNVAGLDPYTEEKDVMGKFPVHRCHLNQWKEEQGLVMLHHSFEHMPDPANVLGHVRRILKPGGQALIRTPVANCFASRKYGPNWVQLDAPRHLFIPSVDGLVKLAKSAGFKIVDIEFDSTDFQFWGSELYQRDTPLVGAHKEDFFSRKELAAFRQQAKTLNKQRAGDSVCFLLERA